MVLPWKAIEFSGHDTNPTQVREPMRAAHPAIGDDTNGDTADGGGSKRKRWVKGTGPGLVKKPMAEIFHSLAVIPVFWLTGRGPPPDLGYKGGYCP